MEVRCLKHVYLGVITRNSEILNSIFTPSEPSTEVINCAGCGATGLLKISRNKHRDTDPQAVYACGIPSKVVEKYINSNAQVLTFLIQALVPLESPGCIEK
jgi:hypothetical protein